MWLSFKQTKEIFWEKKSKEIFDKLWIKNITQWRKLKPKKELTDKEYRKLKESDHWKLLVKFIRENYPNIEFTHTPNEAWLSWSRSVIIMMAKKKALWVSKWFPDYVIYIPTLNSHITLYIELKKARWVNGGLNGSEISWEQLSWAKNLTNTICSFHEFAHWSDEAIEIVQKYIDEFKEKTTMACIDYWIKHNAYKDYIWISINNK